MIQSRSKMESSESDFRRFDIVAVVFIHRAKKFRRLSKYCSQAWCIDRGDAAISISAEKNEKRSIYIYIYI